MEELQIRQSLFVEINHMSTCMHAETENRIPILYCFIERFKHIEDYML